MTDYITLNQAARQSPGKPHSATIWRWCRKGVKARNGRRITLEHVRAGGRIFTSKIALGEFFKAVAEADAAHFENRGDVTASRPRTDRQRARAIEQSEAVLQRGGLL